MGAAPWRKQDRAVLGKLREFLLPDEGEIRGPKSVVVDLIACELEMTKKGVRESLQRLNSAGWIHLRKGVVRLCDGA